MVNNGDLNMNIPNNFGFNQKNGDLSNPNLILSHQKTSKNMIQKFNHQEFYWLDY